MSAKTVGYPAVKGRYANTDMPNIKLVFQVANQFPRQPGRSTPVDLARDREARVTLAQVTLREVAAWLYDHGEPAAAAKLRVETEVSL